MFENMQQKRRDKHGVSRLIFKRGFVDTKAGLQLKQLDVMRAKLSKESQESKSVTTEVKFTLEPRRMRAKRRQFEHSVALFRSIMYSSPSFQE